ncbi:leucine-rich repeat domain-containing protein [Lignipirellula cremea]|uniref:Leucine Rich repeats (2 copies) n=1 Tax=Lignipirellula cremea TaxID=2528010 RepID=A0A518E0M6_9BACT|nr:hypothetical protein [Lignipirellula cremea]QDU97619.1 Leucine Rich repeats (2 copies) [Lignipirellula cremea]
MEEPVASTPPTNVAHGAARLTWRKIVLLVLLLAAGAWLGLGYLQVRQERSALRELALLGGEVGERTQSNAPRWLQSLLGEEFFTDASKITFQPGEINSSRLAPLALLRSLESVDLSLTNADDRAVPFLARLPELTTLFLKGTAVTDKGVAGLAHAAKLERLDLSGCPITPAAGESLAEIRSLRFLWLDDTPLGDAGPQSLSLLRLEFLSLNRCQLTDASGEQVRRMNTLRSVRLAGNTIGDPALTEIGQMQPLSNLLDLSDCPVTDAGLESLGQLIYLRSLDLRGSQATSAGIMRLRRTLPRCRILADASPEG